MEATARPPVPRTRPPPPAPPPRMRAASAGDEAGVSPSGAPLPATTTSSGPSPFAAGRPAVPPRVPPRAGYGTGGRSGSAGAAVLADPGVPFVPSPSLAEATQPPRASAAAALSQPSLPPHIASSAPPPPVSVAVPHGVPVQPDGGGAPPPSSASSSSSAPATAARAGPSISPGRVGPADSRIPVPPRPQLSRASPVSRSSPALSTITPPGRPSTPPHHHPLAAAAPIALAAADPASTMSAPLLRTPVLFPQITTPADSSSSSSASSSSSSSAAATVSFAAIGRGAPPPVPFKTRAQVPPRPAVVPRHAPGVGAAPKPGTTLPPATDTDNNSSSGSGGYAGDAEENAEPWPSTTTAAAAATNIYGSVIERPVTHHQRPALVSSLSAAPGVGRGAMAASPPGTATGTTAAARGRLPPPIPPASAKPTLKPRPGHRRSRSYDPATLRKTLVRPFDPIQLQAKTMEDQPRSMGELRRAAVQVGSDDDSSDGDGVDSGFSLGSGGGGLGMMSMCLGVHPSVRVRAKTGGTSSTLKPSRDLRSSDKADRKAAKNNNNNKEKKKEKERKGFWKKNKKEAKDAGAAGAMAAGKGERLLSAEECRTNADAYHRWFQVLGREDLVMARVLSGVVKRGDRDQATTAFVHYFTGRGVMLALFGHLIRAEVDATAEPGTLLRSNNMLSALLSKHLQLVGRSYLRRVLHPIVAQVCEIATETNFENTQNVLFVASQVLHALRTSIHYCPMSIREICQELAHVVSAKYPDAITSVVGDDGILTQPAKRALVLVSKVLQQLANGLSFGMKETYMIPFNPFLAENEAPVRDYLRLLSTIGTDEVQRGDEDTLDGSESDTRHCLGKLAYDNRDDISQVLASGEGLGAAPELGQVRDEWKRIAADLLGPPPSSSPPPPPL
ncbi:GTPase-activator protein for Ras family GTPase [Acanthamoeba castellanii str. Neff]|uniref:GTPase-activator protein for Ras family GTPase n=1 Tax=Acanthamoeba castellanii (strain ATCC 30010 / Neff) TaxID=1257118 RepID=L8HFM2_ACACF|nr:GTPase-activator protein for Ras family GTPase [Acanthamoeba castellanii str. Neff]ELR24042.1 GTPase-activator protein for Ras family GTPase [Acanthamoeba castellanii str. Neff]